MRFWPRHKTPAQEKVGAVSDPIHAVEIVAHQDANKEVVDKAKAANEQLKRLFDENGFTVKIVLAMGAKQQTGGVRHHGH